MLNMPTSQHAIGVIWTSKMQKEQSSNQRKLTIINSITSYFPVFTRSNYTDWKYITHSVLEVKIVDVSQWLWEIDVESLSGSFENVWAFFVDPKMMNRRHWTFNFLI